MSLNQLNEEFNDAFQTYFPKFGFLGVLFYRVFTSLTLRFLRWRRKIFKGRILVNERIVEYPQIFQWLKPRGAVLDVGCVSSRLPVQLASLGYDVYGIDLADYPYKHPKFNFYKANLFEWASARKFDIIIFLSTLEHMGLGVYGENTMKDENADKKVIDRVYEWLVPGGQILVSVPFGKPEVTKKHRIYDLARLKFVFPEDKFRWVGEKYFMRANGNWAPSSADILKNIISQDLPVNGVAVLNLERL